jgi:hypothetical protein
MSNVLFKPVTNPNALQTGLKNERIAEQWAKIIPGFSRKNSYIYVFLNQKKYHYEKCFICFIQY